MKPMKIASNPPKSFADFISNEVSGADAFMQKQKTNRLSLEIGVTVLLYIEEHNITQKELAQRMGVSPQHVNKILRGTPNLSMETIVKIEDALNIKLISVIPQDHPILQYSLTYSANMEYKNSEQLFIEVA